MYSNSIGNISKYTFVGWQLVYLGNLKLGFIAGVVDDYQMNNGVVVPMGALAINYKNIHFTLIPGTPKNDGALGISFTF